MPEDKNQGAWRPRNPIEAPQAGDPPVTSEPDGDWLIELATPADGVAVQVERVGGIVRIRATPVLRHPQAKLELIRLTRGETERNERANRCRRSVALPNPGIAPHSIVATFVTEPSEGLEDPDQRQSLAARLGLVQCQHPI
jgi:hypothetical protein